MENTMDIDIDEEDIQEFVEKEIIPTVENPKKLLVIVGVPRSGTSLCTNIIKNAGFNVFGDKWPSRANSEELAKKETSFQTQCREYRQNKNNPYRKLEEQKTRDMNRSGFWEDGRFSVRGLNYSMATRQLIYDIQTSERPPAGKIVCQGLPNTDPTYVGQIIYTIRHPRKVAKSQERLKRGATIIIDDVPVDICEELKIHTPEMYIRVTYQACKWLLAYPHIPVFFYDYDKLIDTPKEVLTGMQNFLKEHRPEEMAEFDIDLVEAGMDIIEPSSRRSKPEDIEHDLWEEAEYIYEKFCKGAEGDLDAFRDIVTYMENIDERKVHKKARKWRCFRANRPVDEDTCRICRASSKWVANTVKAMQYKFVEWDKEPCMAECGMSLEIENYISIEESIAKNFWVGYVKQEEGDDVSIHGEINETPLIHKPFLKKHSAKGQPLIQPVTDETFEKIIDYIAQGIPPGMLADTFECTPEQLIRFLREKLGRHQYSALLTNMQYNEHHFIYAFENGVQLFVKKYDFSKDHIIELKEFLQSIIGELEAQEVEHAIEESTINEETDN